ncbi:chemotaxis signal transduction protein [Methylovirgula ligni]|uniref:Chemotaxis signal transduction protein n=1 Tax=Methylovirgula ligni TaxID=569860 RepID=A0A3D9Z7Q2_9HYPH|nr:chemotaxis protein CheW [Methylovirgula ligni]REF89579.1 chemotaxis signal transduction protein [Methylovirgula ligni]
MPEPGPQAARSDVLFMRGDRIYAVAAERVAKVVAMPPVIFPPLLPDGIDGVAAIAGKVVPILALPERGEGRELILVTCGGEDYGLRADRVLRLADATAEVSAAEYVDVDALVASLRAAAAAGAASVAQRDEGPLSELIEDSADAAPAAPLQSAAIIVETADASYLLPLDCVIELCGSLAIVPLPDSRPFLTGAGFHRDELLPIVSLAALLGGTAANEPAGAFVIVTAAGRRCIFAVKRVAGIARDANPEQIVDLAALLANILPEEAPAEATKPPVATEVQAARRYLLIEHAAQACAFPLEYVAHIHARSPLVGVPGMAATLLAGIAATGDQILPVLDLGKAFGLTRAEIGGSLVELKLPQAGTFAVAADRILGIVALMPDALMRPPEGSAISALARIDARTVWVLEPPMMAEHAGWGRHAA